MGRSGMPGHMDMKGLIALITSNYSIYILNGFISTIEKLDR